MKKLFALVNPFVVLLARSFAHRLVSHQVVVLSFIGRRSGRPYRIPVSFVRDGADILCMTQADGVWWRNLLDAASVQVTLSRKIVATVAAVESEDTAEIARALRLFCLRSRISAYFAGVGFDRQGEPVEEDLWRAAAAQVLIRLQPQG